MGEVAANHELILSVTLGESELVKPVSKSNNGELQAEKKTVHSIDAGKSGRATSEVGAILKEDWPCFCAGPNPLWPVACASTLPLAVWPSAVMARAQLSLPKLLSAHHSSSTLATLRTPTSSSRSSSSGLRFRHLLP
ncbi:hypothetical protein L7F22_024706 [Adiantum nelumboides]|nr:hypothetical protein [Adiantum nelumboides]